MKVVVLEVFDEYLRGIVNFHLFESFLAHCFKLVDVGFEMRGLTILEIQDILYDVVGCAVLHTVNILIEDHFIGFVGNHGLASGHFVLKFVHGFQQLANYPEVASFDAIELLLNHLRVRHDGLNFDSVLIGDGFSALHLKSLQERSHLRGVINLTDGLGDLLLEGFGDSAKIVTDVLKLVHQVGTIVAFFIHNGRPLVHHSQRGLLELLSALAGAFAYPQEHGQNEVDDIIGANLFDSIPLFLVAHADPPVQIGKKLICNVKIENDPTRGRSIAFNDLLHDQCLIQIELCEVTGPSQLVAHIFVELWKYGLVQVVLSAGDTFG